ncbi:MAG: antibiotic biosynthesis monooxygenase family protein [Vicingaceae bacterium]
MIVRVVKMHFREEEVANFKAVFQASKGLIRNFPGVQHLELLQGTSDPTIFFTYSFWESEEALERYRHSELFKKTWAQTKPLFQSPAEAWSNQRIAHLP